MGLVDISCDYHNEDPRGDALVLLFNQYESCSTSHISSGFFAPRGNLKSWIPSGILLIGGACNRGEEFHHWYCHAKIASCRTCHNHSEVSFSFGSGCYLKPYIMRFFTLRNVIPSALEAAAISSRRRYGKGLGQIQGMGPKRFVLFEDNDNYFRPWCE